MVEMEEQVKLLVALQDLDLMLREAEDTDTSSELKQMGFKLDGITKLRQARECTDQEPESTVPARLET